MSTAIKGAIAASGVGTAVGGGFLAKSLMSGENPRKSLSSKLREAKFTPLNTDTSRTEAEGSGWKKVFDSYVKVTKTKSELKIGALSLEEGDAAGINKLKGICSSVLKMGEGSPAFESNYKLASKWCVEPISVEDLLKARNITFLDTTGSTNETEWTNVAKRYETEHKANSHVVMSGVEWTTVSDSNYSSNAGKIKTACGTKKSKSSYEEEFEKSLEEAQRWCVATS
ncbi:hypothetical protein HF1_13460 [Mycoplasma haemofelis str. Langford 1]|uniref:Uncharacterized protein n=1 Tax=Mycoplasma haemofelis (strain Langford 1) TaxID=941640 RepID=E8ZJN3_MYCHL|nr:hypothetical protein [Mycoplasma haemofelis]CBY93354.1 hypothetical protein HF1_13460 [Mycoplasma haemofelis str. Langford 1]